MPYLRTASTLLFLVVFASLCAAEDSLADLPKKAAERSQITLPGSRPFVLKAKVLEVTNPSNEQYKAEIEEQWVAPDKWRRTVKTADFSQTLIVNGAKTSEQLTGDYYPNWLRTIVAATFEPGTILKNVDLAHSSDNPVLGGNKVCRRFTFMAGVGSISNKVFSSYCFDNGLVDYVVTPGYDVVYKNYKEFAGKHVAQTISETVESGTVLESTIEELAELKSPDAAMFAGQGTNPPLQTIRADETTLRSLVVGAPDIVWPAVHGGNAKGTLSLYVCVDRTGHAREIYELNSSNSGLSDAARDQVMKLHFKTASSHGVPVQAEGILTFAFHTTASDK